MTAITTLLLAVALSLPVQTVAEKPNNMALDRTIIGQSVSQADRKRWQAAKKLYEECAKCFDQPFPGDD